jgi:hypothetical protein
MFKTALLSAIAVTALCACNAQPGHRNKPLTRRFADTGLSATFDRYNIREAHIQCRASDGHAPYKLILKLSDNFGEKSVDMGETCQRVGDRISVLHPYGGSDRFIVRSDADYPTVVFDRYMAFVSVLELKQTR